MVDVNLSPERCADSNIISIDIPHDGTKRSFKKVKNTPRRLEKMEWATKSTSYWYGEDATDGSTFNYVQDEDGNIHGSLIDISSHSVMQFAVEDGNPTVIITDSSSFGPEIDPPNDEEEDFGEERNLSTTTDIKESNTQLRQSTTRRSYLRRNSLSSTKQEQDNRVLNDDSGGNLDIMVVWTRKAECKNYGLDEGCTLSASTSAAMEAQINLAIDETNTAFEHSGVQTRLYVAHAYRHPTFAETSMRDDLNALQGGTISGTEENRHIYGADLVAMIVDDSVFCGTALYGPSIDRMYSLTAWNCATGYFSFGHEIGHNLGLKHDRGINYDCDSTKFNFGYRDPEARFRTILAYDCKIGQCDNNIGGGCTRIQRFSNPTFEWNGLPVGDTLNDNARKINKVSYKIAQYFPHGGTAADEDSVVEPSVSPPVSPSVSPSQSPIPPPPSQSPIPPPPSQSPTPPPLPRPPPSCNDSPLEFLYENEFMNCAFASSQNLCSDSEIQAICPATCGTCSNCVDPGLDFKYFNTVKNKLQTRNCEAVVNNPSRRCDFFGVRDTCRVTCGTC